MPTLPITITLSDLTVSNGTYPSPNPNLNPSPIPIPTPTPNPNPTPDLNRVREAAE